MERDIYQKILNITKEESVLMYGLIFETWFTKSYYTSFPLSANFAIFEWSSYNSYYCFFKAAICTCIMMSIPSCRGYWLSFWRPQQFFIKNFDFDPSAKNLHGPDLDKLEHFECVKVFPTKPYQKLSNAKTFIDSKGEKMKISIFREFWPICGIYVVLFKNFTVIFVVTDTTTFFQKLLIDIILKIFYSDNL